MGQCSMCGPSIPVADNNIPLLHDNNTSKISEMIDGDIHPFLGPKKSGFLNWPSQPEGVAQ